MSRDGEGIAVHDDKHELFGDCRRAVLRMLARTNDRIAARCRTGSAHETGSDSIGYISSRPTGGGIKSGARDKQLLTIAGNGTIKPFPHQASKSALLSTRSRVIAQTMIICFDCGDECICQRVLRETAHLPQGRHRSPEPHVTLLP